MPNFVEDSSILLSYPKTDLIPLTIEDPTKHVDEDDWNEVCQAIDDTRDVLRGRAGRLPVSVKDFGATGDDLTDDLAAIVAARDASDVEGGELIFPPGTYRTSKYVDFEGWRGRKIFGSAFSVLHFPSDDVTVPLDSVVNARANPNQAARSGLLLRNCHGLTIEGLEFRGGTKQQITTTNIGCGIYVSHCSNLKVINPVGRYGYGLITQEANPNSTGTGDSLTVAAGIVTVVDAAAPFSRGMVGRNLTVNNATNPVNNGRFPIATYVSPTTITYLNAYAITETSSFNWMIEDADTSTLVQGLRSYDQRGPCTVASNSRFLDCEWWRPMTQDYGGKPASFSISGAIVTMVMPRGSATPNVVGKHVYVRNATSAGNNGLFPILTSTPRTGTTPASITYTNASGVTELASATSTWWIGNGESVGIGAGATALAKTGSTMTLTSSTAAFHAGMIGMAVRIALATSAGNVGSFLIASVPSSTTLTFENASGVAETFAKLWTVDSFDNVLSGGNSYGSTHIVYQYAGRSNTTIEDCRAYGCRKTAFKSSGSADNVDDFKVINSFGQECASFVVAGADDSQLHDGLTVTGCTVVDCGTGRQGWCDQIAIWALGARGIALNGNTHRATRNAISKIDGRDTVAGLYGTFAGQYSAGISQATEDVEIVGNKYIAAPTECDPSSVMGYAIGIVGVGLTARYRTGGTLTKVGDVMTLTDTLGAFSQEMVGSLVTLVFSTGGNDIVDAVITSVTGTSSFSFTNAGGTGGGVAAGTYKIQVPFGKRGGACRVAENQIHGSADGGINVQNCVGPIIESNIFSGIVKDISEDGSKMPIIRHNRECGAATNNAKILITTATSFPIIYDNCTTGGGPNVGVAISTRGDMGIGVGSSTPMDPPLLGKRGRMRATGARAELIVAYGSGWVQGDYLECNGIRCTYKSSPGANQFDSFAGLVALLTAIGGVDADEYGMHLTPTCPSGHIRIRLAAAAAVADHIYINNIRTTNPTAGVVLRNALDSGEAMQYSRGQGSAGPIGTRSVIWSPMATFAGSAQISADNAAARTLLAAGWWQHEKASTNAGCCEVILHDDAGTDDGTATEEFRWVLN